ncbi:MULTISPECIES: hypothetical protein [Paraburkholderia]|nr:MULTISPECIES: hypothetical protein [Paraburkholderia]MCX4153067.1 hypothetical protein [Paraburkholderia aspalathi]MDN7162481.1 hypothetical protein [Paraburkholderia sp. SECH2]MDQ6390967.1 hypothetical protein [Paraburkholderia aspalathi]
MKISISQKRRELLKSGSAAGIPSVAAPALAATLLARRNRQSPFPST